jgi:hypothetical protein
MKQEHSDGSTWFGELHRLHGLASPQNLVILYSIPVAPPLSLHTVEMSGLSDVSPILEGPQTTVHRAGYAACLLAWRADGSQFVQTPHRSSGTTITLAVIRSGYNKYTLRPGD